MSFRGPTANPSVAAAELRIVSRSPRRHTSCSPADPTSVATNEGPVWLCAFCLFGLGADVAVVRPRAVASTLKEKDVVALRLVLH